MNVTVFSSSECAVCHAEMKWLDEQGVGYKKVVIDEDEGGMEAMLEATGGMIQGTPFTVIEVDGTKTPVVGFDRKKLMGILELA